MLFIISKPQKTAPFSSQTVASLRASPTLGGGLRCTFYEMNTIIFRHRDMKKTSLWANVMKDKAFSDSQLQRAETSSHEQGPKSSDMKTTLGRHEEHWTCRLLHLWPQGKAWDGSAFCRSLVSPELPAPCLWAMPYSHIGLDLFSSSLSHPDPPGWFP